MADEAELTPADTVSAEHRDPGPQPVTRNAGKAIAAFTLGIISLLLYGVIVGAVAMLLGVLARREVAERSDVGGSGMALAGIIFGAIGFVFSVATIVFGLDVVVPV